jgi:hypothetical protein
MTIREHLRWSGIGAGLRTLVLLLNRSRKKDEWLERALSEFEGVYRFESHGGEHFHHLVFADGRVFAARKWSAAPNFTFTLHRPEDLSLRVAPENVLEVVIANKIGQSGNLYYLYQFGFIMSLLRRSLGSRKRRKG